MKWGESSIAQQAIVETLGRVMTEGDNRHPNAIEAHARLDRILEEATLAKPDDDWMDSGGKQGHHSEHLGYILAEMQFLQRAYPGATW